MTSFLDPSENGLLRGVWTSPCLPQIASLYSLEDLIVCIKLYMNIDKFTHYVLHFCTSLHSLLTFSFLPLQLLVVYRQMGSRYSSATVVIPLSKFCKPRSIKIIFHFILKTIFQKHSPLKKLQVPVCCTSRSLMDLAAWHFCNGMAREFRFHHHLSYSGSC